MVWPTPLTLTLQLGFAHNPWHSTSVWPSMPSFPPPTCQTSQHPKTKTRAQTTHGLHSLSSHRHLAKQPTRYHGLSGGELCHAFSNNAASPPPGVECSVAALVLSRIGLL